MVTRIPYRAIIRTEFYLFWAMLLRVLFTPTWTVRNPMGEGGRVLDQKLGVGESLRFWNAGPVQDKKITKIHTLFRTTPSILLACLGQMTKWTQSCFKAIYWQLQESTVRYIVITFVYLENKQNSSSKSNQSCRKYPVDKLSPKSYTLWDREVINHILSSGTSP